MCVWLLPEWAESRSLVVDVFSAAGEHLISGCCTRMYRNGCVRVAAAECEREFWRLVHPP